MERPLENVAVHHGGRPPFSRLANSRPVLRALLLFVPALAGCANQPGALHIEVSAQEAEPSGRIPLVVQLAAQGSDVILAKHPDWRYEFTDEITSEVVGTGQEWVGYCLMPMLPLLPLLPAIAAVHLLDVADLSGQFDVIRDGQQTTRTLYVVLDSKQRLAVTRRFDMDDAPSVAGRFRLKLELVPVEQGIGPLFWQAYPHTASAETTLEIVRPGANDDRTVLRSTVPAESSAH